MDGLKQYDLNIDKLIKDSENGHLDLTQIIPQLNPDNQFDAGLIEIINKKIRKSNGLVNSLPLGFNRFDTYFQGIEKGAYGCITANTGVGKSQFSKYVVTSTYNFSKTNKIPFKVLWFGLEESTGQFVNSYISNTLFKKYGKLVDNQTLSSVGNKELPMDILLYALQERQNGIEFMKSVDFYEDVHNPFGILKEVRNYAFRNGKFYKGDKELETDKDIAQERGFDKYVPNDPEEYVIVIVDHIGLLNPEKDSSKNTAEAMSVLSKYALMQITKKMNYSFISVQQQAFAQESTENYKLSKLKPSLQGLGDNKLVGRDYNFVISVFSPAKHELVDFNGYDIHRLKDSFRWIEVIKNRFGTGNYGVGTAFYGECNMFYELPPTNLITNTHYELIKNRKFKGEF